MFDMEAHKVLQRVAKIDRALEALPQCTAGDWWCDRGGELHNDPIGSVKLAKYVDGGNPQQRAANRALLSAAKELAEEVRELRELLVRAGRIVGCLRGNVPCELELRQLSADIEARK